MPHKNVVAGIDIGNSAIKTIVAEIKPGLPRPQLIGVGISTSNGLRRGMVIDLEEAIENVKNSVMQAQESSGVKIQRAYVSISGPHIKVQKSKGVIAVSRADGEISENDIQRVIDAASAISLPANREIIHIIPEKYIVDGQEFIKSPVGMKGIRLEADILIIDGLSQVIKNLAKVVNENNIEVAEFVFSPLASAKAVLSKKAKEHGALCLDFGGGLCNIAVFEEGQVLHAISLPIGSKNITNDLAIVLKTSLEAAEQVKLEHGFVSAEPIKREKEIIDLSHLAEEEEEKLTVSKKHLAEVINARVSEMVDMISKELKKISKYNLLPGGITLIGGGSKIEGFVNYMKNQLRLPARKISSYELDGIANRINDPSFAVAVGLVLWGAEKEFKDKRKEFIDGNTKKFLDSLKNWFKNFLP